MSREAMQMALEALESDPISHAGLVSRKQAITALRQALVASQERVDEKAKREHEWVWLTDEPKALRLADALDAEFVQGRISNSTGRESAVELRRLHDLVCVCGAVWEGEMMVHPPRKREWVGLTDEEIDALSQARSLTDELMDCVDRLGSEADTVDPRVWQHLLVYAPKPEEEPVAWMHNFIEGNVITHIPADIGRHPERWTPLYTAPPKREWVGLTDEEIISIGNTANLKAKATLKGIIIHPEGIKKFYQTIEAKLKEKNHG